MEINHVYFEDDIVSQVGKFAILWNDFENRYLENGDYRKLKSICSELKCHDLDACEDLRIFLSYQRSLHTESDDFIQTFLYTDKSNKKVKDDERTSIDAFLDNPMVTDEQLYGCLLIIKRFRDNLMHGIKNWHGIMAQKSIVELLNLILESLRYK